MKICLVNDLRNFPNWGCRSTGLALSQLLEEEHTVSARIGLESGNNCPLWDMYAEPMVRVGGLLPKSIVDKAWQVRRRSRHLKSAIFALDALTGARHDYICKNPKDSIRLFETVRQTNEDLNHIFEGVRTADALVINGEGTMIFRNPMIRDALFLLFILELAFEHKKPVYFVNSMFSDSPLSGRDADVMPHVSRLFKTCEAITVRDNHSRKLIQDISSNENVVVLPDALFTWQEKILLARKMIIELPDLVLPFGADDYVGRLDLSRPYLCLAGSSLRLGSMDPHAAYCNLYDKLKRIVDQVIIVQTCEGDDFLEQVAKTCGALVIRHQIPVIAGAALLAGASVFVTGRFHPAIMASCGGTPCIFMGSNSHKNLSLQEMLEYKNSTHFSSSPSDDEMDAITSTVKDYLSQGQDLRNRIFATAQMRAQQARMVLDELRV